MSIETLLHDAADAVGKMLGALAPAAFGSLVAQIHERGLAWRDRLLAYVSGILVSYYVGLGLQAWLAFDDFVRQSIGFVIGMIAFKATPRFIAGGADIFATLPDLVKTWLARKGA
ncbi:hypothetical protein [Sphingomonas jatrophae]|uniref:Phage holin, lambda family n=1 Tax=Sphingomonas jatrophae TaxID=1166337 RepID=A0A1I6JLF7_9SPHN|nr:hypothetical protein [Sphingomonas jatrophae]SFR79816.1 hypothetical protein SAMN05192580_0467 [Sphingomonas jatrophae]